MLFYTYVGYPLLLLIIGKTQKKKNSSEFSKFEPSVSMIIPAYNEEKTIKDKIKNTLSLEYPVEKLDIIIVSDASTDNTNEIIKNNVNNRIRFFILEKRQGKAAALNRGLQEAKNEIIIFSDTSIMLGSDAVKQIVAKFQDENIGCISGEDYIPGGGGEGFYGKYELLLRNLESEVGSIVGASGCFYAQRRSLCVPFKEGLAPDFLSVLKTVEKGYRAVTEPEATGIMQSLKEPRKEFQRKLRTFLRGITTLMEFKHLLNPFKYGFFSIELLSHKILRWSAGIFLIILFLSNVFLLDNMFFRITFILQLMFYATALIGWVSEKSAAKSLIFNIPLFFCMVNLASLLAWLKYFTGTRQELWDSSRR